MQRLQQLTVWLQGQFPGEKFSLAPASSDASFRRYFRASFDDGGCDSANGSLQSSGEPVGLPPAGRLLMEPLADRLNEQTTLAKSLVMAKPADCGNSRQAAPEATEEDAVANLGGCGHNIKPQKNYDGASSDDVLAEMFASTVDIPFSAWASRWRAEDCPGKQLLVWAGLRSALQRGDLHAWRVALQTFETDYAQPLWDALRGGKLARLQIDVLAGKNSQCWVMTRGDTWRFWRRGKRLAMYSIV